MRAVARGDDTASTLKHEQQVGYNYLYYDFFLANERIPSIFSRCKAV